MTPLLYSTLGAVFAYLLSRAGATEYDYYAQLFLFTDLQLMWVIGAAVAVSAPGMYWLKRNRPAALVGGEPLELAPKPMKRGLFLGAVLFGAGWGLAGACPGTALAMLGQGKLSAGVTVLGILFGTWLYGIMDDRQRRQAQADTAGTSTSIAPPA